MILLLSGCMTLDGFFFNPTRTDAYDLQSDVIPASQLEIDSFAAPDGETLYGYWARQEDDAPIAIYYHGNAGNLDDTTGLVGELWSLGLTVYAIDYEGYGMSTGSPSYDALVADAVATADHVSAVSGVAPEEMVYYGQSLGGFASIQATLARPPQVLVTDSTFAGGQLLSTESASLDMPAGWVLADGFDNVGALPAIHVPILVMHGLADDYIDIHHGDAVYAAANPPKFYWQVPGANHAELDIVDPEGWKAHVSCWIGHWSVGLDCLGDLAGTADLGG